VLAKYDPEVVRFFILRAHYRSPLNYSDHHLDDAKGALTRLYTALKNVPSHSAGIDWQNPFAASFKSAMEDDFNTPEALAVLFELATEANKTKDPVRAGLLQSLGGVLGLLQGDPSEFLQGRVNAITLEGGGSLTTSPAKETIEQLIADRTAAKQAKNYAEADRIRKELADAGILLEDSPQGTTWRRS
jgi:cysteinyl-tRNA synthetase